MLVLYEYIYSLCGLAFSLFAPLSVLCAKFHNRLSILTMEARIRKIRYKTSLVFIPNNFYNLVFLCLFSF